MTRLIRLEILSLIPITYKQCSHCEYFYEESGIGQLVHDQILEEYPPQLLEEKKQLTSLVIELTQRFRNEISIEMIDPQSFKGILKALRFRVRKYPAFIVNNEEVVVGWDRAALERVLDSWISTAVPG